MSGWGRATRSGVVWSTLSFLAGKASTTLSMLVLARLVAPEEFGVLAAIVVFLALVELASDMGMNATVVFEQERGVSDRVHTAFTLNVLLAAALTAVAVLCAPLVAAFFGVEEHTGLFRIGALTLLVVGLGNIHDALLLRGLEFRRRAIPEVVRAVVRAAVSVGLAVSGLGAEALVLGLLSGSAAWTATQWLLTDFRPRLQLDRAVVRSMVGYGSGAVLLNVLSMVVTRFDAVVIGRVLGPAALGLYTIAFRVPELLIDSVAWNLSKVSFPALSRLRAEDRAQLGAATLTFVRYQALFGASMGAGLAVLGTPLVVLLFGEPWREAGPVMSALAVMSGVHALVFPLGDVLKAIGRQRAVAALQVVEFPLLVAGIVLAAPAGILAVAWVRCGVLVLHALMLVGLSTRVLGIAPRAVVAATRPAVAAACGIALGTGAVRVLWEDGVVGPVLLGGLAGLLGGLLALRLAAPELLAQAGEQLERRVGPRLVRLRPATR